MGWDEIVDNEIFKSIVIMVVKVVGGLFVIWILFKLINAICKKIESKLNKNPKIDVTVASFVSPLISKLLKFFVVVCYIGYIGIETSSIAAAITSAGLAIGLAMQGSLSNFAGGFVILIMRPFKVGDYIETCGESGTVESIQIFYTTLITPDNKVIKIPNGEVANSSIVDFTSKDIRRVDMFFSIAHENDIVKAKRLISECIGRNKMALTTPFQPFVNINACNDNSIEIVSRVWVKTDDYWDFYYQLIEDVKKSFVENTIKTPHSKIAVNFINK